jgi:hypothetical protein
MTDTSIDLLISTMNKIPYIQTLSCCGGHPEELAVPGFKYGIANIHLEIKDEQHNLFKWYSLIERILHQRKQFRTKYNWSLIIAKQFLLEDIFLAWNWILKIQAEAKTNEECRNGLDEGIKFLIDIFKMETEKTTED